MVLVECKLVEIDVELIGLSESMFYRIKLKDDKDRTTEVIQGKWGDKHLAKEMKEKYKLVHAGKEYDLSHMLHDAVTPKEIYSISVEW